MSFVSGQDQVLTTLDIQQRSSFLDLHFTASTYQRQNWDIRLPTIQMLDASSIGGGAVDIVNYLGDTPAGL